MFSISREIIESYSAKMKSIFPNKNWKQADLLKIISKQKPYFEPGTDFHYSNSNYIILGCILEKVYEKSFGNLLEDEIITALFDGTLVSDQSLESMINFVNVDNKGHSYWTGYGMGVTRFNINNHKYWDHEGLFIGFESFALYSSSEKYSIALIGNISSYDKFTIIRQIHEILSQIK